jgi:UDP-3-O-[3-hydroxymyristoyl] glucosamine N-acyltransferase
MLFAEVVQRLTGAWSSHSDVAQGNPELTGLTPIDRAQPGTLSYIEGDKFASYIDSTSATALVIPAQDEIVARATARGLAWIAASEPRLLFAQAIGLFYQPFQPQPGIHPTAIVGPEVVLGTDVHIGAHGVIHGPARIGDRVVVHANVVIYPDVEIGADTVLHANCTIQERSRIGQRCTINSGTVIGGEGFGYVPTPTGWFKMQQSGYTILEDGVEIGCNSAVDRAAVGETRIGRDTKIDNMVQIGHGCRIGSNCAIAAQVGLAGGVTLGDGILLGGQAGITNKVHIGSGARVSAKTGITNDVDSGQVVSGYPAMPHALWLKTSVLLRRLPEMYQMLKKFS